MKTSKLKKGVWYRRLAMDNTILQYKPNIANCRGYWERTWAGCWGFNEEADWTEATYEELEALGTEHRPYSKYLLEDKVYTIKDLAKGRVALEVSQSDKIEDLQRVVFKAFPNDEEGKHILDEDYKELVLHNYLFISDNVEGCWKVGRDTELPKQTLDVFLKELERDEVNTVPEELAKYPLAPDDCIKIEPKIRTFESGATRNLSDDKLDFDGFLSPLAIEEFAKYMHKHRLQADGTLRPSDNWQKGIPVDEYMKSMYRHFFDTWKNHRGHETPEDQITNLCAVIFNAQGMLHELLKTK